MDAKNACAICEQGGLSGFPEEEHQILLRNFKLCAKHRRELMECSFCNSQDVTPTQGISKKTGNPWKAYDCNEPHCVQANGKPNRTFVPTPKPRQNAPNSNFRPSPQHSNAQNTATSSIEKKLDQILAILKANFPAGEAYHPTIENDGSPF